MNNELRVIFLRSPFSRSPTKEKGRRLATYDKKKEELITSSPLSMNNVFFILYFFINRQSQPASPQPPPKEGEFCSLPFGEGWGGAAVLPFTLSPFSDN
jgi:hypothetical protein